MPNVDLSEIVNDPDLAQSFVLTRTTTTFVLGGVSNAPVAIPSFGVIQNATGKDLDQLPEADRVRGGIVIWNQSPMFVTSASGISDQVTWQGENYRIQSVANRSDLGNFYRAVATRTLGA